MPYPNCYEPDADRLLQAHSLLATNAVEAVRELEALAAAQSTLAPLYLGWAYQKGDGVIQDTTQAEHWFKTALARGDATSSYYLGHLYGKLSLHQKASDAFERGSELGYLPSTYCLAMNIREGKGRPIDMNRVLQLLTTASTMGHVFARRSLATLYLSGRFGLAKYLFGMWLFASSIAKGFYLSILRADDSHLLA